MRDWRARLEMWVDVWDRLEELTRDCFPVSRSSGLPWPVGLPTCPALTDFYARCDGGTFGAYLVSPVSGLGDPSAGWLAGSPGPDLSHGRWVEFGSHEFGHTLLWNADADEVMLYSPDDEEPRRLKRTMEAFLERLFYPSAKASNETTVMWAGALAEAEAVAKAGGD